MPAPHTLAAASRPQRSVKPSCIMPASHTLAAVYLQPRTTHFQLPAMLALSFAHPHTSCGSHPLLTAASYLQLSATHFQPRAMRPPHTSCGLSSTNGSTTCNAAPSLHPHIPAVVYLQPRAVRPPLPPPHTPAAVYF